MWTTITRRTEAALTAAVAALSTLVLATGVVAMVNAYDPMTDLPAVAVAPLEPVVITGSRAAARPVHTARAEQAPRATVQ
jgi:hypothetical protein